MTNYKNPKASPILRLHSFPSWGIIFPPKIENKMKDLKKFNKINVLFYIHNALIFQVISPEKTANKLMESKKSSQNSCKIAPLRAIYSAPTKGKKRDIT